MRNIFSSPTAPSPGIPGFSTVEAECTKIVNYFNTRHKYKWRLHVHQMEHLIQSLKLAGATRWASLKYCIESIIDNMNALILLCTPVAFVQGAGTAAKRQTAQEIRDILMNPEWIFRLRKCVEVLKPICVGIIMFQNDSCPISSVYHFFTNLHTSYATLVATNTITIAEKDAIVDFINERWVFIKSDCHEVAFYVDPRFMGLGMTVPQRVRAEALVVKNHPPMAIQLAEYRVYINALIGAQDYFFNEVRGGRASVQLFINQLPQYMFPLVTEYLKHTFSLVCSSAASERNFSTHAFIHSKARNRLGYDKVKMLVYIFVNTPLLDNVVVDYDDSDDDDDEEEENADNVAEEELDLQAHLYNGVLEVVDDDDDV